MRKSAILEIEEFIQKHNLENIKQELFDLCSSMHTSGWVDGSNDYIEWDEEE